MARMASERAERHLRQLVREAAPSDEAPIPLPEIQRRIRERVVLRDLVQLGSRLWHALVILLARPVKETRQ